MLIDILLWVVAAWLALGAFFYIGAVGKKREPITPGNAATTTLMLAAIIVVVVLAAVHGVK